MLEQLQNFLGKCWNGGKTNGVMIIIKILIQRHKINKLPVKTQSKV